MALRLAGFQLVTSLVLAGVLMLIKPAAAWAAWIEFSGKICPLTPLENWLRIRGGGAGYAGDFIGHYLMGLLYPFGLTRGVQIPTAWLPSPFSPWHCTQPSYKSALYFTLAVSVLGS